MALTLSARGMTMPLRATEACAAQLPRRACRLYRSGRRLRVVEGDDRHRRIHSGRSALGVLGSAPNAGKRP